MCLSCTNKRWISAFVREWSVFQNTVTFIDAALRTEVAMQSLIVYYQVCLLIDYLGFIILLCHGIIQGWATIEICQQ